MGVIALFRSMQYRHNAEEWLQAAQMGFARWHRCIMVGWPQSVVEQEQEIVLPSLPPEQPTGKR